MSLLNTAGIALSLQCSCGWDLALALASDNAGMPLKGFHAVSRGHSILLPPSTMNKDSIMVIEGYCLYLREGSHAALHKKREITQGNILMPKVRSLFNRLLLLFDSSFPDKSKEKKEKTNKQKKTQDK